MNPPIEIFGIDYEIEEEEGIFYLSCKENSLVGMGKTLAEAMINLLKDGMELKKRIAERITKRLPKQFPNGFNVTLHPERLSEPYHWKKPRMVFVCSMSDGDLKKFQLTEDDIISFAMRRKLFEMERRLNKETNNSEIYYAIVEEV
jgi:protein gp37